MNNNTQADIDIQWASTYPALPKEHELITWAEAALSGVESENAKVTIRIVDEDEISQLNEQFRQKHGPTNVLSFPFESIPGIEESFLGDIVISAPVVAREAEEQAKTSDAHWAHMVVHGLLHLQGFDHMTDEEAEVMEAIEVSVLAELGFANPYTVSDATTN